MLPSIKFIKDWKICIKLSCIKVIKFINSRNPKDKQKIKEKFELLQNNPYPVNFQIDSKKLQNKNGFRLRINNYRFIYADNRGDIY